MSIIMTPTKSRVSHRSGPNVKGMEDGMIRTRDEIRCTNTPLWLKGDVRAVPDREASAIELARTGKSPEQIFASKADVHREWIITAAGEGLVAISSDFSPRKPARVSSGQKPKKSRKSGTQGRNDTVDALIRATGWTGPINKMMRDAARDAIAFRAQVKEMSR